MTLVRIKNLSKSFFIEKKEVKALDNISLDLNTDEKTMLIGPSGCGKSSLLKTIAGLIKPDQGHVGRIKTSLVFQNPRLLPWLNVYENIEFSNKSSNILNLIQKMGLEGFEKAYPSELSIGMKARVNLARGLNFDHDYLLLDEPFASLDQISKEKIEKEFSIGGFLFVSHDLDEVIRLGQRVLIMNKGRIIADRLLYDFDQKSFKDYFYEIIRRDKWKRNYF